MRRILVCSFVTFSLMAMAQDRSLDPQEFEKTHAPTATVSHHRVIARGSTDSRVSTPGVTIVPSGDFLVAYNRDFVGGQSYHALRRSLDGGLHWEPEVLQWNASTPDPTLWITPGHRLFIEFGKKNTASMSGAAWSISDDNGYTWGSFSWFDSPINETYFVTNFLNIHRDVYGAGYQPYSLGDGTTDANLWLSQDDATSWRKIATLRQPADAPINETAISRRGKTGLFAISRSGDEKHTYAHISRDMGRTWSSQFDYTSQVGVLDDPNLLQIGNVLVLVGRNTSASQLVAFFSRDEGLTFGSRLVLDSYVGGIDGIAYSALVPLRNDSALIVYSTVHGVTEIDSLELQVCECVRRHREF